MVGRFHFLISAMRRARAHCTGDGGKRFVVDHQLVAEAMASAEIGRLDVPDELFLTFQPNPWWVTCLRRLGETYYDDSERFYELDPASLVRLTKR